MTSTETTDTDYSFTSSYNETSTQTNEEEATNEKPTKAKRQKPTANNKLPLKQCHELFQQFFERDDVQSELAGLPKRKRAAFLTAAFLEETGEAISLSWVYRILKETDKKDTDENSILNEENGSEKAL
jgi:hypothetical protein